MSVKTDGTEAPVRSSGDRHHHAAEPGIHAAPEKRLDHVPLHRDELVGGRAVGFHVHGRGGLGVRRVDETADRAGVRVEPPRQVAHAEALLRLEVLPVRRQQFVDVAVDVVVDVHEQAATLTRAARRRGRATSITGGTTPPCAPRWTPSTVGRSRVPETASWRRSAPRCRGRRGSADSGIQGGRLEFGWGSTRASRSWRTTTCSAPQYNSPPASRIGRIRGQVLVSNVVRELCAGKRFRFESLGEVRLKGFGDPVTLYRVLTYAYNRWSRRAEYPPRSVLALRTSPDHGDGCVTESSTASPALPPQIVTAASSRFSHPGRSDRRLRPRSCRINHP